jgi:hypothetical protein
MQVERSSQEDSGERVSNALVTCPGAGDNSSKGLLIPHKLEGIRNPSGKAKATLGGACVPSASW